MININKIKLSEINEIEQIGKTCLPIYYSSFDLIFLLYEHNFYLFKITENNKIVGFIIAEKKFNTIQEELDNNENKNQVKRCHIMSIAVLPEYRKKGYATQLIKHLRENCNMKMSLYVLTTNESAIKLYEKNGFVKQFEDKNYYTTLPTKSAFYYETN